jgi:ABC-type lipoprotein release transport system permease subunit
MRTRPPLAASTYYRRNLTRTLPVGGAIMISVFLIAGIVTLLNSVDRSITTNFGFTRHFSILATQLIKEVPPNVAQKARQSPHVSRVITAVPFGRSINTVFGQMPIPIYGLDQKDMPFLARLCGNRLGKNNQPTVGRWPTPGDAEIVLSRTWAQNLGVKIGDMISPEEENMPTFPQKQKLVGLLDGGDSLAIVDKDYLLLELPEPVIRPILLYIPKSRAALAPLNTHIADLIDTPQQHGLKATDVQYLKFFSFERMVDQLRRTLGFLYKFLSIADALVIGAVALLSGFLANIYFEQRLGEFGLLSAFGFRRERLARRVVVETGILVVCGWAIGLFLTWLMFQLLDYFYMRPNGLVLATLDASAVLYTAPIPILVGVASLATVLLRLYRMDPIEIMEHR